MERGNIPPQISEIIEDIKKLAKGNKKIKAAIKTDSVLSLEIVLIALGTVLDNRFNHSNYHRFPC